MILSVHLFNLLPNISNDDFVEFDKRIIKSYTGYFNNAGSYYLGQYKPVNTEKYNVCEVNLWDAKNVKEAKNIPQDKSPVPKEIEDIISECRSYQNNNAPRLSLWFESVVYSANSKKKLNIDNKLLRLLNFEISPEKTLEQLIEFENRIEDNYTNHMNLIDWNYMGVFEAFGLPQRTFAEVDFVNAGSREEALEKDKQLGETPEITKITKECRTFFGKVNKENSFWLKPLFLSEYAKAGILLNT